ncbi:MAG: hypothetical protein WD335_00640 [Candidatus Paceibacterota bacterium]
MDILETLFSSAARVRILRTFLFQPRKTFSASDIAERTDVASTTARAHAQDLAAIKLLHEVEAKDYTNGQSVTAWKLNRNSSLRRPLHEIVLKHQDITPDDIKKRLERLGDISLLVLSGIFSGTDDRPIDVLIAGSGIDTAKLARSLSRIEKSFGTELRYTHLSKEEFDYRRNAYDRLIRDVLDYPHHVLIDEKNVTTQLD